MLCYNIGIFMYYIALCIRLFVFVEGGVVRVSINYVHKVVIVFDVSDERLVCIYIQCTCKYIHVLYMYLVYLILLTNLLSYT